MIGELYFKDIWRFAAIGQGFNGGLSTLLKHFGGEEEVIEKTTVESQAKVSPSKITLEKHGDKISLEKPKNSNGYGRIICNLNWKKRGFFGGNSVDLDLGCLYELSNGIKGVTQALGNRFGSYEYSPYTHLAGDDRSGASINGEFLYINGNHLRDVVIFEIPFRNSSYQPFARAS